MAKQNEQKIELEKNELLRVEHLKKYYAVRKRFQVGDNKEFVYAVDDVGFSVYKGESFGIVGESGCGKTTTARMIARAIEPTEGDIWFRQENEISNLAKLNEKQLRKVRQDIQMVFQDPYSSLNPRMSVFNIVAEPMICAGVNKHKCRERVAELLEMVGLNSEYMVRYPHAFSGGQRQRIGIARAISMNPSLLLADEAVSALDVSVQAQILNLLLDLKNRLGITCIFIGHDLGVIRYVCDRVAVMYMGKIVEIGPTEELFFRPLHPYTRALLNAVPDADPKQPWMEEAAVGEIEEMKTIQKGCAFAPRCPYACEICHASVPKLKDCGDFKHLAACHRMDEIEL